MRVEARDHPPPYHGLHLSLHRSPRLTAMSILAVRSPPCAGWALSANVGLSSQNSGGGRLSRKKIALGGTRRRVVRDLRATCSRPGLRLRMPYSSASVVACSGCWEWRQPFPHEAFAERCEVPVGTRPISSFFGIAGRSTNLPCIQIVSLFHFTCLFCLTRKFLYLLCKEGS